MIIPTTTELNLGQRQRLFMELLPRLLNFIYSKGYEVTGGDLWAKTGHKNNSNHYIRLAIDLNLFLDGKYLEKSESHLQFGKFWMSLHPLCRWGGNWDGDNNPFEFGESDGNHYSIEYEGRA